MKRRTLLAGLLTIGGGAAVGTGAFSTVQSERSVSIGVADDSAALLGIEVNDRYGGQTSNGLEQFNLQENLFASTGFNPEGTTILYGALAITNNSGIEGDSISVQFSYESDSVTVPTEQSVPDSTHDGEFSFRAFDPETAPANPFDGLSYDGEQEDVADPGAIPAGETAIFDLVVDPDGELDPDTYSVDVTLVANIGGGGGDGDGESTPAGTAIYNWNNLHKIRNDLGGDYYLADDLDEDSGAYNSRVDNPQGNWDPIGKDGSHFTGTFDGNGYTIQDLVIDRPNENEVGLFGRSNGTIENVRIEDADVTGDVATAALVGKNTNDNNTTGTVKQSYATGTVVGDGFTGGLVGNNYPGATVETCYATTTVSSDGEFVGGLVGFNSGILQNSYATGDVSSSADGGDDDGVGGLVGWNNGTGSAEGSVVQTYATGAVDAPDIDKGASRLVGYNNSGSIEKSYADSTSSVTGPSQGPLVGLDSGTTSTIAALATSEMQGSNAPSNMSALDFTSVWGTVTSPAGYPVLQALDKQTQIDAR